MRRTAFDGWPCSIARTVDVVGDGWTALVLRETFYGTTRFDDIQQALGIARTTLTDRLGRLVDLGLLEKSAYQSRPARYDYLLTDKGSDFFGVLAVMSRWGDKWLADEAGVPIVLQHTACGHDTHADVVCHECRQPLQAQDVTPRPGPGYPSRLLGRSDIQRRFASAVTAGDVR
ncbi:MAG: helix-turn-helix domain-containing protein [Mycobacterium sp.]|uniref:winged helix-turn-helix transcriptional regulator n=1 Tax=Mycobacterium sp. TaxID=1785 RepID=UPI003CC53C5B